MDGGEMENVSLYMYADSKRAIGILRSLNTDSIKIC